jgi:hypothetical protein
VIEKVFCTLTHIKIKGEKMEENFQIEGMPIFLEKGLAVRA